MHKFESKSRITVNSVMIETFYTSSRTPMHNTVMLPLLTEVCGVFNDWLNVHSWQNRIQHVIAKKTRQGVTPYFCVIPAWYFNALVTRKCTMNSYYIDPKFTEFLFISRYFGIGTVSFYFLRLKIINVRYKKTQKRKTNVSTTYGGPLQCHKLKD